jgi:hypothetical protein
MMAEPARVLVSAFVSGSITGLVSAGALAALTRMEGQPPAAPINATSHWWHGDRARTARGTDLAHTCLGFATHHASSVLWAVLFEALRARHRKTGVKCIARDAAIVAATAGVVDYMLIPRRLSPGWELVLPARSVAAGLVALAAGLTLGGLITRQFNRPV